MTRMRAWALGVVAVTTLVLASGCPDVLPGAKDTGAAGSGAGSASGSTGSGLGTGGSTTGSTTSSGAGGASSNSTSSGSMDAGIDACVTAADCVASACVNGTCIVVVGGLGLLGGPPPANNSFILVDDGLEIGSATCNATYCLQGGISP